MGDEILVESKVCDSQRFVETLDKQGDPPATAAWYYFPDDGRWRFFVAGPSFDALLPQQRFQASERVVNAWRDAQLDSLRLGDVQPVRTDSPLVQALRQCVRIRPDPFMRASIHNNMIDRTFIKDALVIRAA